MGIALKSYVYEVSPGESNNWIVRDIKYDQYNFPRGGGRFMILLGQHNIHDLPTNFVKDMGGVAGPFAWALMVLSKAGGVGPVSVSQMLSSASPKDAFELGRELGLYERFRKEKIRSPKISMDEFLKLKSFVNAERHKLLNSALEHARVELTEENLDKVNRALIYLQEGKINYASLARELIDRKKFRIVAPAHLARLLSWADRAKDYDEFLSFGQRT